VRFQESGRILQIFFLKFGKKNRSAFAVKRETNHDKISIAPQQQKQQKKTVFLTKHSKQQ